MRQSAWRNNSYADSLMNRRKQQTKFNEALSIDNHILVMNKQSLRPTTTKKIEQIPCEATVKCERYIKYISSKGFRGTYVNGRIHIHHSGHHIYDPGLISSEDIVVEILNIISVKMIIDWNDYKDNILSTHKEPDKLASDLIMALRIIPGVGRFGILGSSKINWINEQIEWVRML